VTDPLHATVEEFAADGYTHIECYCPRCRLIEAIFSNDRCAEATGLS